MKLTTELLVSDEAVVKTIRFTNQPLTGGVEAARP